jgi:acyl carrier protein
MQPLEERVIAFVSEQLGVRAERISMATTIFGDLHTDGDDGVELLESFDEKFSVDMTGCDPSRYFGPEGCVPWAPIYWILIAMRKVRRRNARDCSPSALQTWCALPNEAAGPMDNRPTMNPSLGQR